MPCLNEVATVGRCVAKAQAAIGQMMVEGEVVVADNGSTDGSVQAAERAGARVVHCPVRGYGAAIRWGARHCRGHYIVIADADDSYDLAAIEPFVRLLQEGGDLALGDRFAGRIMPGAMPWKNRYIGNPLLTGLLNLLFRAGVGDAHCGLRSIRRPAWERLALECDGMEFASEMVVKAVLAGLKIAQVPITYRPDGRCGGRTKLRPWRDGLRHVRFRLGCYLRWKLRGANSIRLLEAGSEKLGWTGASPRSRMPQVRRLGERATD